MTRILAVALLSLFFGTATAADTPPSAASVKTLLGAMQAHRLLDSVVTKLDNAIQETLHTTLGDASLSPAQQKIVQTAQADCAVLITEGLSWDQLEAVYVEVYSQTFTQGEVDGMIAFYRSPAGTAFVEKMPAATQLALQKMQPRITTMTSKVQERQRERLQRMVADIKASD